MGHDHGDRRRGVKRGLAGEQMMDGRPQRVEIAAGVDHAALPLLRAHVERGTKRHAVLRELEILAGHPHQPEVGHLHVARRGHEQVLRLDVAMHDALLGGPDEGRAHLREHGQRLPRVERPPGLEPGLQRWPGHVLLGQEVHPVEAGHLVNLHDMTVDE